MVMVEVRSRYGLGVGDNVCIYCCVDVKEFVVIFFDVIMIMVEMLYDLFKF